MTHGIHILTDFPFDQGDQHIIRNNAGPTANVQFVRDVAAFRLALPTTDILCTYRLPNDILSIAPQLRWLQYPGAGIDSIIEQGFTLAELPFHITSASSANAPATAEFVMSMVLNFARKWQDLFHLQEHHEWASGKSWGELRGFELRGKTIGIVGFGTIGRYIAKLAQAFQMRVIATRRDVQAGDHDSDCEVLYPREQLHVLLHESDIVVLSVPLTNETRNMIGELELQAMHADSYLINIARGEVIHEQSLIRALRERWIAGAGLDVADREPLPPEHPLWSLPGVLISPHLSGLTTGYTRRVAEIFAANIVRFQQGQTLLHQIDAVRGY